MSDGRRRLFPGQGSSPDTWTFWALRADGDSVSLSWRRPPGYGPAVSAAVVDGRLEGRVTATSDVIFMTEEYPRGEPHPWRPFTAEPIPCERDDGTEVAPPTTVEELWGATPPLPSCYVGIRPAIETERPGTAAWTDALTSIDTLVLGPPGVSGENGWIHPAPRGVPGRWSRRAWGDPRVRLSWSDGFGRASLSASLWGDTLRASGVVPGLPPDPLVVPTSPSPPRSQSGSVSFGALRVDCAPGPSRASLPTEPPPPHPGVLRRAGCYALSFEWETDAALEPMLSEMLATLGTVELHTEFEIDRDGDPEADSYRVSPLIAPSDSVSSDVARWRVDVAGDRITLFWGTPNRVQLFALFEGDDMVGTADARVRDTVAQRRSGETRLLGNGLIDTVKGTFRAERTGCG